MIDISDLEDPAPLLGLSMSKLDGLDPVQKRLESAVYIQIVP